MLGERLSVARENDLKGYCLMNITKREDYTFLKLCSTLAVSAEYAGFDFFIFADSGVNPHEENVFFWYILNNVEPGRDVVRMKDPSGAVRVFVDGTAKTKHHDGFSRPWPNPVVMDEAIIRQVDSRWEEYRLGSFLESPSKHYMKLTRGHGAIALENNNRPA